MGNAFAARCFAAGAGGECDGRPDAGAELATIHSSIQQASALVPDYGALMAWRIVLLVAALVFWIAPQLKGYQPALPLLSLALCWYWRVN